jgi:hypothetical protein
MADNRIASPGSASGRSEEQEWRYAEKAMIWSGWGSPVGAGLFLVGAGIASLLLRFAILGF